MAQHNDEWERAWASRFAPSGSGAESTSRRSPRRRTSRPRACRALENGSGSRLATLVKVVRALGREDWLDELAPLSEISPLALLRDKDRSAPAAARAPQAEGVVTYVPATVVRVDAWGETVGAVALDPSTGLGVFEYAPEWVERGPRAVPDPRADVGPHRQGRVPLARDVPRPAAVPRGLAARTTSATPSSTPTSPARGSTARRSRRSIASSMPADGRSGRSSSTLPPPRPPRRSALDLGELVTEARSALRGDLVGDPQAALRDLFGVGTSAGGARAKAVVAIDGEGRVRSGSLPPEPGWTDYLLKFDGTGNDAHETDGYTRIEYRVPPHGRGRRESPCPRRGCSRRAGARTSSAGDSIASAARGFTCSRCARCAGSISARRHPRLRPVPRDDRATLGSGATRSWRGSGARRSTSSPSTATTTPRTSPSSWDGTASGASRPHST